jgi:hypothetical protein
MAMSPAQLEISGMSKEVNCSTLWGNEAKAFSAIEPFDYA